MLVERCTLPTSQMIVVCDDLKFGIFIFEAYLALVFLNISLASCKDDVFYIAYGTSGISDPIDDSLVRSWNAIGSLVQMTPSRHSCKKSKHSNDVRSVTFLLTRT